MQTLSDSVTVEPVAEEDSSAPAVVPSWKLTDAICVLRLTVADASLRAREEAHAHPRAERQHWAALGRAQGFYEAASILRGWTHPQQHDAVLARLAQSVKAAASMRERVPAGHPHSEDVRAFHEARAWTLRCVLNQVGELCAHSCALS